MFKAVNNTIKGRILLSVITPFLIILTIAFFISYNNSRYHVLNYYQTLENQTEKYVENSLVQLDKSYKMSERMLMPKAQSAFNPFLAAYSATKGVPSSIDLNSLKAKLGNTMDLYIINSNGVIISSTFKPAIGINFNNYPKYKERLDRIRQGNIFVGDRLNVDLKTAAMRYWGFMPTPDHNYLLEVGLAPSGMKDILDEMNISSIEHNLKELNPILVKVRLFNWIGYNYYDANIAPTKQILNILDKVRSGSKKYEVHTSNGHLRRYFYINLYDKLGLAPADPSYMVELTYNMSKVNRDLIGLLIFNIIMGIFYVLIGFVIIVVVAGKVTRPIVLLYQAVRGFAEKDFSVRAPIVGHDEIGKLSGAFNMMARTIENYSVELENKVEERTKELSNTLDKLKETQEQAIQNEKMASLGQLVAGIAHEINTPLASIKSNIDMQKVILEGFNPGGNEELKEIFDALKSSHEIDEIALDRIIHIVKNLRNFARLDESDFKEADLHEGIDSTLQLVNYLIRDKVKVTKDYGHLPLIACYPRQLNQVFLNIIVNAIQAMDKNGELLIKTQCQDERILITFKDNGCGISDGNLKKIFNPGFTTKGVGVGTGLGLSISYRIVEKHNGKITVKSKLGTGSEFTVELPVTQPESKD